MPEGLHHPTTSAPLCPQRPQVLRGGGRHSPSQVRRIDSFGLWSMAAKKKLHRSPQRPGNHVTRRQTPKVPLSNTSNFYFLLFLSDRLAHAPAASPPALSSFQHFGLWEASGYLLSSSTGLGGPKAQPLPGGRSRCSRGRGTERPPLLPRPGVGRLGLSCWARGARRGDLPAWSGSRRSRVAVAAGPPPHVPTAGPPPTRPGCGGPGPHFSQPGKEVCERRGGRWGWGGVIGETRRKDKRENSFLYMLTKQPLGTEQSLGPLNGPCVSGS